MSRDSDSRCNSAIDNPEDFFRGLRHSWSVLLKERPSWGWFRLNPELAFMTSAHDILQTYKDWSYYLANLLVGTTAPPVPEGLPLISKEAVRIFIRDTRARKKRGTKRRCLIALVSSVLQLKRALPPLPRSLEGSTLSKHREVLSSQIPPFEEYDMVEDIIETYFPHNWFSRSAFEPGSLKNGTVYEGVGCTARNPQGLEGLPDQILVRRGAGTIPLRRRFQDAYDKLYVSLQESLGQDRSCRATLVPDAGKFRTITIEPRHHKAFQGLQKALFKHLLNFKEFSCLKVPVQSKEFGPVASPLIQEIAGLPGKFLSIDYSLATDGCEASRFPELIGKIIDRSGSFELMCLRDSAVAELSYGKVIHYKDLPSVSQTRGTLMGSLLSFPLLCLWNASIIKHSVGHRKFLVLGDDGLVKATVPQRKRWEHLSAQMGCLPSPGKVFHSNELITFASQYYRLGPLCRIERITWTPVSLILNGSFGGETYNLLPPHGKDIFRFYSKIPKRERRPLFGPRCYGGLGAEAELSSLPPSQRYHLVQANLNMKPWNPLERELDYSPSGTSHMTWVQPLEAFKTKDVRVPRIRKKKIPRGYTLHLGTWRRSR